MIYKSGVRVLALIATLILLAQPGVAAPVAGEGTLNFGGRLVAQTCTIAVNNSTSVAPLVQLPRVSGKCRWKEKPREAQGSRLNSRGARPVW